MQHVCLVSAPHVTPSHGLQTEREKANAVDMHTTFQQELVRLRLKTAQAYYKVLTDGQVCSHEDLP